MLSPEEQDKKLVKQYKKVNKTLRKQLQALNQQIDYLILQKSNRIGLEKIPKVEKQHTDIKVIHSEVQNLKKRLQHIKHDNQQFKQKVVIDWLQKYKQLTRTFDDKILQKQQIQKHIKVYEKRLKQQKTQVNIKKQQDRLLHRIQIANQQLARIKKIQNDLNQSLSLQQKQQHSKQQTLQKLHIQQKSLLSKSKVSKKVEQKFSGQISDESWQRLKQQFLLLKESKQQEQMAVYEQNQRLRREVKVLNQQLKIKRGRGQVVRRYSQLDSEKKLSGRLERLQQRNTIDNNNRSNSKRGENMREKGLSIRYRDRNNSISYN